MTNEATEKNEICRIIQSYTTMEFYNFITSGENPFQRLLCEKCKGLFGACPENVEDDEVCRIRFGTWCNMKKDSDQK